MPAFIMAASINPSAKRMMTDLTHQIDESLDCFSRETVKVIDVFATLGRYDYIVVFEAPDQSEAFRVASEINAKGVLETETWPVIPYEDFSQLTR